MIKRFFLPAFLLVMLSGTDLSSQSRAQNKMIFYDAESWVLFEDYKEALPEYLQLLEYYPSNANIKYRIGQCYINIPGEKEKAISYLEDAVQNINPAYKEGRFRETGAPWDAYYQLADAYRITGRIDKALETYRLFKKNLDPEVYDSVIVNRQIESCLNAKELMNKPLFIKESNLGKTINDNNSEYNPVVSDDENMLIFSKSEPFYEALLYSVKTNGTWRDPANMNEILKVDRDIYPSSLSRDGKTLFLYNSQDYDGNIFSTVFTNGSWNPIEKLNDNINTKYWESHAVISHDNRKLYFTSNRKGSIGGLDIYVSTRDINGDWGTAENLGPVINTPYNEDTPFLSEDDKTLYFSSRGHFNMGGYDIFRSTLLDNGEWSEPVNIGYPLNTTDDDHFFQPVKNGYEGYFSKYSPAGFGGEDIYRIEVFSEDHPRSFFVMGLAKGANVNNPVKVSATDSKSPDKSLIVFTNPKTGQFEFNTSQGNYDITYESAGSERLRTNVTLPFLNPSDTFRLPDTFLAKSDFSADLEVNSESEVKVDKDEQLTFPLRVEPNSTLVIEHRVADTLVSTDTYSVADSTFAYVMTPLEGENMITFRLTDPYGNTAESEVSVTREKPRLRRAPDEGYRKLVAEKKQDEALAEIKKRTADTAVSKPETVIAPVKETDQTPPPQPAGNVGRNTGFLWWILFAAGFILLIIIILRRRKDKGKK
jgi:hypothetical protein